MLYFSYPINLHDCEIWIMRQRDIGRLKTTETKFVRCTTRYNVLDQKKNEDILEELKVDPLKNESSTI